MDKEQAKGLSIGKNAEIRNREQAARHQEMPPNIATGTAKHFSETRGDKM